MVPEVEGTEVEVLPELSAARERGSVAMAAAPAMDFRAVRREIDVRIERNGQLTYVRPRHAVWQERRQRSREQTWNWLAGQSRARAFLLPCHRMSDDCALAP